MQVSARILGKDYGLTAEEMNRVLVKQGFLEGIPNNYRITEKAVEFVREKDYHRGTGGYDWYNSYWNTRTFDDSIKDHLNVTPELKREVCVEVAASHAEKYAKQAADKAKANAEFLANQAEENASKIAEEQAAEDLEKVINAYRKTGIVLLVIGGCVAIGFGIYKAVYKIKARINQKQDVDLEDMQDVT